MVSLKFKNNPGKQIIKKASQHKTFLIGNFLFMTILIDKANSKTVNRDIDDADILNTVAKETIPKISVATFESSFSNKTYKSKTAKTIIFISGKTIPITMNNIATKGNKNGLTIFKILFIRCPYKFFKLFD